MAKKTVNSDIYNLSQLVDDVKQSFIPNETEDTLSIGTYGYIGALESSRLQTQVLMTGELCNEVFPSRARLDRNVITHAIMTNIEDINAIPSKMVAFLALRESDIIEYFDPDSHIFIIDRECPIYFEDFEFHLEYDINLKKIEKKDYTYTYTAWYTIPPNREVPTSSITDSTRYLSPPAVMRINNETYIYLTVTLSQVEHHIDAKKLVTSNIIDNKTINFEFENQLAYFEIHCTESDQEYYIQPVFEGASIPDNNYRYYCWYQYIDSNLIRVRFDRQSYMPGLNANVECLVKTCQGTNGNFTYGENVMMTLESELYGYKNINAIVSPISDATGGKDRKSKKELQGLIPKEALARGSLTTITDLNNYFGMLDSELGRIIIQKKIDNQKERVYYAYFIAKDSNGDIVPSNTIDIKVGLEDLKECKVLETDNTKFMLPFGACIRLDENGIGYINHEPLLEKGEVFTPNPVKRGQLVEDTFEIEVVDDTFGTYSCSVDVGDASTTTNVFPSEDENDRYSYTVHKDNTIVEDYIQMGCGHNYTYTIDYITQEDNSIVKARDKNLECFDLVDAYYTANGVTRHFKNLPIEVFEMPKNTKITFGITRRLNTKAKGICYFNLEDTTKVHMFNQKWDGTLSSILASYGLEGEVQNAVSNNLDIVSVVENGVIYNPTAYITKPVVAPDSLNEHSDEPYTLYVAKDGELPKVEDRKENEWFYVVEEAEPRTDSIDMTSEGNETDKAYELTVVNNTNVPPLSERKENEWFYVINNREDRGEVPDIPPNDTNSPYQLDVVSEEDLPPAGTRPDNQWYYVVEESTTRKEDPDDPDDPDPEGLYGKEYDVDILRIFEGEDCSITVTIDGTDYNIIVTQDRHVIENGVYVTEDIFTAKEIYQTYIPTLDQDVWPENPQVGDRIKYTLKYKSTGTGYAPDIMMKLSRGLDYVLYSNYVTYPLSEPLSYEPEEVSLEDERGFVYTNPYTVNINGYRLYSSFYMMSIQENPYLHFDYINESSNIQFIATNITWDRPFFGDDNMNYKMSITLTQSVQDDLGLISADSDNNPYALVKAFAVFKRDGKNYRYRSLNLESIDENNYSFTFSQEFDSEDLLDNDNNIKINNIQAVGQKEFSVDLSYGESSININNGDSILLSELIETLVLPITTIEDIDIIRSSNYGCLIYEPIHDEYNIIDYRITPLKDSNDIEYLYIHLINATSDIEIAMNSNFHSEYGFFNPTTDMKIYVLCGMKDSKGEYSRNNNDKFDYICPGYENWTHTNTYNVVNGVTMYHNYSEIMGSRVRPYGKDVLVDGKVKMKLEGYYIDSVPVLGYDYCQNEVLVQEAINALNYRKTYIDSTLELLENSFGIDLKLFNTYGPSKTLYVIKDIDSNGYLDDTIEYINRVDLSMSFRIKLLSSNDSYTRGNIIKDIKEYVEDLEDIEELHIPNLISQITNEYSEQIQYIEYLGLNNGRYGPDIQHIYKKNDNEIPIHTAPEFISVHNNYDVINGTIIPDINIYISEI